MGKRMETIEDAVAEMKKMKSKLPPRPTHQDVNYATQTIERVDNDLEARLKELFQQTTPPGVPNHVFRAYQEMREDLMRTKAQEEKRMAVAVKESEERHQRYEFLIQKAQDAASHPLSNSAVQGASAYDYKQPGTTTPDGSKHKSLPSLSEDSSYSLPLEKSSSIGRLGIRSFKGSTSALNLDRGAMSKSRTTVLQEAPTAGSQPGHDDNSARHYPTQLLQLLERAKEDGQKELSLSKMDLEYVPEYIGNLTQLTSLDLSANQLKALPESICELTNLTYLNIQNNQLTVLPDSIGCLINLGTLNMAHNKIEELPITISLCSQLVELKADFNNLKVLPEATGNLTSLERLDIHMNEVQRLPTTLYKLTNLVELRISTNHISRIPDSVCHLPKLAKLDASSNFTELRELPVDIGYMQSLRELNVSNNQITELPVSFARLTGLEKLEMDQNPWVIPPLDISKKGKEAVLQFMKELEEQQSIAEKEAIKKPGLGAKLSSVFRKKKKPSSQFKVKPLDPLKIRA
ncbi:hypothetical protein KC19_2G226900 [Ceratodon purpureus]|uniref:Disease resistance R13L4/SHOC-2-like LRR domain-containing protein n=1 Tax=Ceratodon purpureus TaxID=3225 RepID=A0A8T0IZP3_CERPU|nr:hypothetical protein KC19_2G226900 [Ceratodon purpureus]